MIDVEAFFRSCRRTTITGLLLSMLSPTILAQTGSVAATGTNAVGARAGSSGGTTGARVNSDAPLAVVRLDNERNPCFDDDRASECRIYWLDVDEAEPEIAYYGGGLVQFASRLSVIVIPVDDQSLQPCLGAADREVEWRDTVEAEQNSRTVANVDVTSLQAMYRWATTEGDTARYKLVWCEDGKLMPLGQSWRVQVRPD